MMQWSGTHGFEPHIEKLVENFIPPYLVGHERLTMDPYVARPRNIPGTEACSTDTGHDHSERDSVDRLNHDSNCWSRLESELANYVAEQKALGVIPTDKMLQDHARLQVYGTVEEWDWTAADNQVWLDAFRCEQGISRTDTPEYTDTRAVPLHAPYVVKGGMKSRKSTCANHMDAPSLSRRSRSTFHAARLPRTHSDSSSGPVVGTPVTPDHHFDFDQPVSRVYHESDMQIDIGDIALDDLNLGSYVDTRSLDHNPALLSADLTTGLGRASYHIGRV